MAIKELTIQVRISEEGVASLVKRTGFDESASSHFEVIGIIQNLLTIEQKKLDEIITVKK